MLVVYISIGLLLLGLILLVIAAYIKKWRVILISILVIILGLMTYKISLYEPPKPDIDNRKVVIYQDEEPIVRTYINRIVSTDNNSVVFKIEDDRVKVFEDSHYKFEEWK